MAHDEDDTLVLRRITVGNRTEFALADARGNLLPGQTSGEIIVTGGQAGCLNVTQKFRVRRLEDG